VGGVAAVGGQRAAGDRRRRRGAGRAVIGLRIGGRGDGDRALVDHAGGVVDEGDRIGGATVAVVDGAGRGQRLAAADVAVVVGLAEVGGVAAVGGQRAGGDRRRRPPAGRAVVALGVGCRGDRDRSGVDGAVVGAHEGDRVVET